MDIFTHSIEREEDILAVRDRARVISSELGFTVPQQMQITTSIFELGKNILQFAGKGSITISLSSKDETLQLDIDGVDEGEGMTQEQVDELLQSNYSNNSMRGIPAMKRMMDQVTIDSKPGNGTKVTLVKQRNSSTGKSLAQNIAGFFQEKFSARKTPTISDEFELQNTSLMQTLSLYEEKNQELERKNKELTKLQTELETANHELEEQSAELQEALLTLGDSKVELEENNRRFTLTLDHIKEGIVVTDRTGEVKVVNQQFLDLTGKKEDEMIGIDYQKWCDTLSSFKTVTKEEWDALCDSIKSDDEHIVSFPLYDESFGNAIQCEVIPVLSEEGKVYGKLWIFT